MKITLHPLRSGNIIAAHGVMYHVSFERIVHFLKVNNEIFLDEDEYVAAIIVEDTGLTFNIKKWDQ